MPIQVEFSTHGDRRADGRWLELFCDGVERWDDPPQVETGTGVTPKILAPHTIALYGVDAVALRNLEWTPRYVTYPYGEASSRHIDAFDEMECDLTRSVVTLQIAQG